ncbi:MAG: MoaD/ThiS family protein [Puniceicoccaceae bacterium]
MKITVLYFAKLKAVRGVSQETFDTPCQTIRELYESLGLNGASGMPHSQVKPAVNESFCGFDTELNEGDVVAFMPPMSGG